MEEGEVLKPIPSGCGRCEKDLVSEDAEYCWFCMGMLCAECWDKFGHCGHKRAKELISNAEKS